MLIAKKIAIKAFCLILGVLFFTGMDGQNFNEHLWENRVLIVQSDSSKSSFFQKQLAEFDNLNDEMAERKLVLYQVSQDQYKYIDFQNPKTSNSWKHLKNAYLQRLTKSSDSKVVLIGLDGNVKLEQAAILSYKELFNLIDSMPMRRAEIKEHKKY